MTTIPDEAYCPTCRAVSLTHKRGLCVWCDAPIATGTAVLPAVGARSTRGLTIHMDDATLAKARALYATGLSLRAVAAQLVGETSYASALSMAQALHLQFHRRGWQLRGRHEARRARAKARA